jgi:hypothetical protein
VQHGGEEFEFLERLSDFEIDGSVHEEDGMGWF